MKGIFALAAMGWFALASGVILTNPRDLAANTIYSALTSPPGDLKLERDYELAPLPRKVVNNGLLVTDVYLSNVKLTFSSQPQHSLSLSLYDPQNLKIEGQLTFPYTVVTGDYNADLLVNSGKIKSHFTGNGYFKLTVQTAVIEVRGKLALKSPELLTVDKLDVGNIAFPGGADLTATGARLNGVPLTEADVQRNFKDALPLALLATQQGFKFGLKTAIDKALAKQTFSEWKGGKPGPY